MDNEKLQINLAPGMSKAELVIREGAAPKELDPKAPRQNQFERRNRGGR